jgi:hypothetical protein
MRKKSVPDARFGWAGVACGAIGLLLALGLLTKPRILIGSLDIALPVILGVAGILLALRGQAVQKWIGTITGAIGALLAILALGILMFDDPLDDIETDDSSSSTGEDEKEPVAKLLESGFGQSGEAVSLVAIVRNEEKAGGQTVNVSFNLMDPQGEVVATVSGSGTFSWGGEELAVVTDHYFEDKEEVAKIEPTVSVESFNDVEEPSFEMPKPSAAAFSKDEFGERTAKVKVVNPSPEILKNSMIAVVCRDKSNSIVGGGYTYPDLIAASGVFAERVSVVVSGPVATCVSYLEPGQL